MQGPSSFVILQAQQVIITGTVNTGLFVYNGARAKGNLITQIVPPGVTTDGVGNNVASVFNVGKWSPTGALLQHMGVDANGNVYVADNTGATRILIANGGNLVWAQMEPAILFFNAFGAVIQVVDPQRGGNFQYQDNNSATQGPLIGSQVGKNTTDPINGVSQNAGINIIDPVFGDSLSVVGANIAFIQVAFTKNAADSANSGSTNQGPFRSIAAPEQGQAGHAVQRWYGKSPDGTRGAGTVIAIVDPPTRQTPEVLEVQGNINLANAAGNPVVPTAGPTLFGVNHLHVMATDGNNYIAEKLTQFTQATQVFNSGAATAITSLSVSLASGSTYHVRLKVFGSPTGTIGGAHVYGFNFTGVVSTSFLNGQAWQAQAASAVQQTALNNGTIASTLTSPTHVAFVAWAEFDFFISPSTNGVLTPTIAVTIGADTFTTSPGTHWEITPVA